MLRRLISEYTAGRSSSVPVETAQDLLHSLCFTLRIDPENWNLHPKTVRMLLQNDPEQMLAQGRKRIQRQLKLAQQLALRLHLQLNIFAKPRFVCCPEFRLLCATRR